MRNLIDDVFLALFLSAGFRVLREISRVNKEQRERDGKAAN